MDSGYTYSEPKPSLFKCVFPGDGRIYYGLFLLTVGSLQIVLSAGLIRNACLYIDVYFYVLARLQKKKKKKKG